MKKTKASSAACESARDGVVLRSDDGRLFYWLRATRAGLWVQRDRRRLDSRARLVQSHLFETPTAFARWCDADSVRFDYPVIFTRLHREGHALLTPEHHGTEPSHRHAPE